MILVCHRPLSEGFLPVIVDVAGGRAKGPPLSAHTGGKRDVVELEIALVPVETAAGSFRDDVVVEPCSVGKKKVEVSVLVEIQESDSISERAEDEALAWVAADVMVVDGRMIPHLDESSAAGLAVR